METNSSRSNLSYFGWAFLVTAAGLVLAAWLGWATTQTLGGVLSVLAICAILSVLEISLSFDNAIVNANILKRMEPKWQRRFLTWGILIAVFGMRLVFPLLIVMVAAKLNPVQAVVLAASQPEEYARIMHDAHPAIAAFGGAFLSMVALSYFVDEAKDVHWLRWLERRLARLGALRGVEIGLVLAIVLTIAAFLGGEAAEEFIVAAVYGLGAYLAVDILGNYLDSRSVAAGAAQGGLGAFLYLEMLDASFSFDGVVGAFALTQNLFVIAIGLAVGAMYVRSMTIMLVERGTLNQFRFLEHGAFYAVLILALLMFLQTIIHVPELVTGGLGVLFIGAALWSSIVWRKSAEKSSSADTD